MIKLNGYEIEFMLASGSCGFDGRGYWWKFWEKILAGLGLIDLNLFTTVLKSISVKPHRGNRPLYRVVKFISENGQVVSSLRALIQSKSIAGAINAIGLDNPGFDYWLNKIYPEILRNNLKVVFSAVMIGQGKEDEFLEMISRLNELENIIAVEFNPSCSNISPHLLSDPEKVVALTSSIFQISKHPLILKLGYSQDYCGIAKRTEKFIKAISINSVPWLMVFPVKISPLARYGGGGVSGKKAQFCTWQMIKDLKVATSCPIIAPSVWDYEDIEKVYEMGASAISFGSVGLLYAWRPTQFVRQWMKKKGGKNDSRK